MHLCEHWIHAPSGRRKGMKVWLCTTKTNDGATVDGAEIQRENQLSLVVHPIICKVFLHPRWLAPAPQLLHNTPGAFWKKKSGSQFQGPTRVGFFSNCSWPGPHFFYLSENLKGKSSQRWHKMTVNFWTFDGLQVKSSWSSYLCDSIGLRSNIPLLHM